MTFPIVIERCEGQFRASLVGDPGLWVGAPTQAAAVAALKEQLRERVAQGQLLSVDVDSEAVWGLAGKFADDPTLRDICADAYAARDAEVAE
jgi:hypothetical protein